MSTQRLFIIFFLIAFAGFWGDPLLVRPLRNVLSHIIRVPAGITQKSANESSSFLRAFSEIKTLGGTIQVLRDENAALQAENLALDEAKRENEILRQELGFKDRLGKDAILAQVIGRSPQASLQFVLIDRGKADGVTEGALVLAGGFMVGKVEEVDSSSARVSLLGSPSLLVPVVLSESRGIGLLKGGLDGWVIEDIPLSNKIQPNEGVLTSEIGGKFPAGVPVGSVKRLLSQSSDIFQKVEVESPLDFNRLEIVSVLK